MFVSFQRHDAIRLFEIVVRDLRREARHGVGITNPKSFKSLDRLAYRVARVLPSHWQIGEPSRQLEGGSAAFLASPNTYRGDCRSSPSKL